MKIRTALPSDCDAVLRLTLRLAEHGTPVGRDRQQVERADLASVAAALAVGAADCQLLVAEANGETVGFVHAKTVVDYYTQQPIGHVSDLVVAEHAQGQGVATALLEAAQDWASGRGYSLMQLYVLPENAGARAVYERAGYRPEWIKYVRPLPSGAA
jgi:ribosomal protein S18 acetylase RimI-like enzyme